MDKSYKILCIHKSEDVKNVKEMKSVFCVKVESHGYLWMNEIFRIFFRKDTKAITTWYEFKHCNAITLSVRGETEKNRKSAKSRGRSCFNSKLKKHFSLNLI